MPGIGTQIPEAQLRLRRELVHAARYARPVLAAARPHAPRWAPPSGLRMNGVLVRPATVKLPWVRGYGPNRKSTLSHVPRWALIAWVRGRPALWLVQYWCGQSSFAARAEAEPTGAKCPHCMLASGRATICEVDG